MKTRDAERDCDHVNTESPKMEPHHRTHSGTDKYKSLLRFFGVEIWDDKGFSRLPRQIFPSKLVLPTSLPSVRLVTQFLRVLASEMMLKRSWLSFHRKVKHLINPLSKQEGRDGS